MGPEGYYMNGAIHELQHLWQGVYDGKGASRIRQGDCDEAERELAVPFVKWYFKK